MTTKPKECGCKIMATHATNQIIGIQYCPLHAAAPVMLEALKKIEKAGTIPWKDSDAVHVDFWAKIAKEAIRAAGWTK